MTPRGLHFIGPGFADDPLRLDRGIGVTAVGGTQIVKVSTDRLGDRLFQLRFDAASSDARIEAQFTALSEVALRPRASGEAYLRLLDPQTRELFDRVRVKAREIRTVSLRSASLNWIPNNLSTQQREESNEWALYSRPPNGTAGVLVRLFADDGSRLVDEAMALRVTGGVARHRVTGWDRMTLDELRPGNGAVEATTAGRTHVLPLRVVDAIDRVELTAPRLPEGHVVNPPRIGVGETGYYCFHGVVGAAAVVGLDWSFAAVNTGVSGQGEALMGDYVRCVAITPIAPGRITVTARAAGRETSVELEAVRGNVLPPRPGRSLQSFKSDDAGSSARVVGPSPGERAALIAR